MYSFKIKHKTLVPSAHTNIVSNKWVYLKHKVDGSIDRFNAPLVAHGFPQQPGIDYEQTFSPVVKLKKIKLVLFGLTEYLPHAPVDISNAFSHTQ